MSDNALEVSRVIKARPEQVWQAWTEPAEMMQWLAPENLTTPAAEVDLTVGGAYRIVMNGADGEHVAVGTYSEIVEGQRLAFSWKWEGAPGPETSITVSLEPAGENATKVTLRHEGFADEKDKQMHTQGWESTLNKLEKQFA